jgi:hypothetical protein
LAFKQIGFAAGLAAALVIGSATFTQQVAQAQPVCGAEPCNQVESVPKGAVGLGLIGAEIGFVLPAVIGLHQAWAFVVFPLVLGGGGAVGGYFAFDEPNSPEAGVAMLAAGIALIIPSLVLTLAFTSYDPGDEVDEGEGEGGDYSDEFEEGAAVEESARRRARERVLAGGGLLHVGSEDVSLGVPAISVRPNMTAEEAARYGGQTTEVHVPVVSGAF